MPEKQNVLIMVAMPHRNLIGPELMQR